MIKFVKCGPTDMLGFAMYEMFNNDIPVMHKGEHVKIKAMSVKHCFDIIENAIDFSLKAFKKDLAF